MTENFVLSPVWGRKIGVIGGISQDVGGKTLAKVVSADKNIGTVTFSLGGVGCNIARNLALIGGQVELITAFGNDWFKSIAVDQLRSLGIGADLSFQSEQTGSASYLYILDNRGEMQLALSDLRVIEELSPDYLQHIWARFDSQILILDCNLTAATIDWISAHAETPIIVDPVSRKKAERLAHSLARIDYLTPNLLEAQVIAGSDSESPEELAELILGRGVKNVIITLGEAGCYYAGRSINSANGSDSGGVKGFMEPRISEAVNVTGAGDAFTAGLAFALTGTEDLPQLCTVAMAMASLAVESELTVNPDISFKLLKERISHG
jgi:pseudouridine kinase